MKRRNLLFCVLAAAVFYILPGFVISVLLTWLIFYLIRGATPAIDKKTVLSLLAYSLAVRIILFCVLQYFVFSRGLLDIFGDAQDNIVQGIIFSDYFKGGLNLGGTLTLGRYNTHGMSFFNGLFFTLFGNDIISLKYINILAVTVAGWLVYDFMRNVYSSAAGKISAAIFLFWPTLIFWTLTDLKEAHLISSLIAIFWLIEKLGRQKRWPVRTLQILALLCLVFYVVSMKYKLMLMIISLSSLVPLSYHAWLKSENKRFTGRIIFYGLSAVVILLFVYHGSVVQKFKDYYGILFGYYNGSISSGGWTYNLFPLGSRNLYSLPFFIRYVTSGWFHFLTEPLPWHFYSYGLLSLAPVMLLWYVLLFYSLAGMAKLKRLHKIPAFAPMLTFVFLYVTSLGMAIANIGTVVRFRDTVMPIVAMLAACAFCAPDKKEERA